MSKWKLMALRNGMIDLYKAIVTLPLDFDKYISEPIWMYAVYNDEHRFLVDSGIRDVKWVSLHSRPCRQEEDETLPAALKKGLGWEPGDVEAVFHTHLHYDHCGGNIFLPNAVFYVQNKEWDYAFKPLRSQKECYHEYLFDIDAINHFRWRFLDGDTDILPGIKVIATPGHSPGHQSMLVDTQEGVVCISGDTAGFLENFSEIRLNTTAIKMSEEDTYNSIEKMGRCANFVCPGHDPNIEKYQNSNFPRIKDLKEDKLVLKCPPGIPGR